MTSIAAYLLQDEIIDARDRLDSVFGEIYNSGEIKIWPPKVPRVVGYQRSVYPTFSNVLLHVNGARFDTTDNNLETANLEFDETSQSPVSYTHLTLPTIYSV